MQAKIQNLTGPNKRKKRFSNLICWSRESWAIAEMLETLFFFFFLLLLPIVAVIIILSVAALGKTLVEEEEEEVQD